MATTAKVVGAGIAAATTAVVAFAKSSVETGMTFDSSMSQVAATMGTTVDKIQNLRDFAMEMGATTAFSASQAADALNYMALAGYDAETSMEMLPNVLNLAAAGGMGLATASDMVTDAQSALGLSMEETTTMVDQMAKVSSTTNTSVSQLGEAILTIGATASTVKGGTSELTQVLGLLADNGIKGAEGGTHLRNVILSLQSPTDQAWEAMQRLGVSAYDNEGNFRSLQDIFQDLGDTLDSMSAEEKANTLSTIFNKTDLASVNALLNTNVERWDEVADAIANASGAAEAMADTQLDNLAGDITLFKSAMESAQIILSDQLSPALRDFVQFGTDAIGRLTTAFQNDGLSGAMTELGSIIGDAVNMIIEQLPTMVDAGMQLLGALGQGIIDNLPTITSAALEIVMMLAEGIFNSLPEVITAAAEIIYTLGQGLADSLPELIPQAVKMIIQIVESLIDNVDKLLDAAIEITLALADGLIDSLPELIEKAPVIIEKLVTALIEATPKILMASLELIVKLVEGIISNLPKLGEAAVKIIATLVTGVTNLMSKIREIGSNIVSGVWNGINEKLQWFKDKVTGFFSGIVNGVKSVLGIASPSKVFAGIGENMALGVGKGWDSEFSGIKKDIEDGMDFGSANVDFKASGLGRSSAGFGASILNAANEVMQPIIITVQSVLDGKVIGETAYKYNRNRERAYGV